MISPERREQLRRNTARYRLKYPDRVQEASRKGSAKWRRDHPEENKSRTWVANLKRRYGLTSEQYDEKLASQNNLCGLCKKPFDLSRRGTSPALDHNHDTNGLREFLHHTCNVAIGLFLDDPVICRQAAEYLERHSWEGL
jgi:hypothetical protein